MAVVKANAYGHGAVPVARCLQAADAFAVARVHEGIELRSAGIDHPILLLEGVFDEAGVQQAEQFDLDVALHQPYQLDLVKDTNLKVWLKLETGMHRLGLPADFLRGLRSGPWPAGPGIGCDEPFFRRGSAELGRKAPTSSKPLLAVAGPLGSAGQYGEFGWGFSRGLARAVIGSGRESCCMARAPIWIKRCRCGRCNVAHRAGHRDQSAASLAIRWAMAVVGEQS